MESDRSNTSEPAQEQELRDLRDRVAELDEEIRLLSTRLADIESSVSWRLTAPLRALSTRARDSRIYRTLRARSEYTKWVSRYDRLDALDRERISREIAALRHRPLISIVLTRIEDSRRDLETSLASLKRQLYPKWELLLVLPEQPEGTPPPAAQDRRVRTVSGFDGNRSCAGMNAALREAAGGFATFLEAGDRLAEHALFAVVKELNAGTEWDLLYSDDDEIDGSGRRRNPFFKPDWSPDLLHAHHYLRGLSVYRTSVLRELGGFRPEFERALDYELALRFSEAGRIDRIRHIPRILCHHRSANREQDEKTAEAERRALQSHFRRLDLQAEVTYTSRLGGHHSVFPAGDPSPLVSVIVPTRDRVQLLSRCLDGVLNRTEYAPLEALVVDNESTETATLQYYRSLQPDHRVRVIPYAGAFNFSAINNRAVTLAKGELIAFLNNDLEVTSSDWLSLMAGHARRPDVGAVGALLYYPSGRIQHAGIVLGSGGVAAHRHRGRTLRHTAYDPLPLACRDVSAVTAACMVLRKEVFEKVGGFDEANLKVAFNDVDLCLRIREHGYRIVWVPDAALTHHESQSLGRHDSPTRAREFLREKLVMHGRWNRVLRADPFYSPNLDLELGRDFQLAFPPR